MELLFSGKTVGEFVCAKKIIGIFLRKRLHIQKKVVSLRSEIHPWHTGKRTWSRRVGGALKRQFLDKHCIMTGLVEMVGVWMGK